MGRAGLDLYADPPGTCMEDAKMFSSALGGSAANIAAGIVRLGGQASLLSAVSHDAVGRFIQKELKNYGINADHVAVTQGETRSSLAVVETRIENCQSVIYRNGAADFQLNEDHVRGVNFVNFGALIVTGTCFAAEPSRTAGYLALELARKAGLALVLDIDYRPYSWSGPDEAARIYSRVAALCDIVVGNDQEFAVMAGGVDGYSCAKGLAASTAQIVIYKMGEKGSITLSGGAAFETGIFPVTALKPTGAGDAFMAGFVTSLADGASLENSVKKGSAAAAIVVTRVGCAPAMPTSVELEDFIASHFL